MNSKLLGAFAMASVVLFTATGSWAQPAYFTAITNLNPAGYWPMHEVETAAPGDIETNYGTLGLLGTGYYPDWAVNSGAFVRNKPGALAGDTDTALAFTRGTGNSGTAVFYTNGVYIPHTSPLATLNPPFTVECWFYPTNAPSGEPIWSQTGAEGLNLGGNGGLLKYNGMFLNWANGTFVPYGFNGMNGGFANANKLLAGGNSGGSPVEPVNNWYYLVVTCDANTNFIMYINGSLAVGPTSDVGKYAPDYWTPLSICSGYGSLRSSAGYLDEFAVYPTNLLAGDIAQHYSDGINATPATSYFYDVTNDNPAIYLRMDSSPYTAPDIASWPALTNDGAVAVNGVYTPGTMPGIVTGPATIGGIPYNGLSGPTVAQLSGISSFANAGYDPAYNPTGSNANFSVSALFRGNPCDDRIQSIVGRGTNSWQLSITTNGCIVFNAGNGNKAAGGTGQAAGDIRTIGVYNDGNWHQVVAVNSTNLISIYVDGALDTNGTPNGITLTNLIAGNANPVIIGSDPTYTNNPVGAGRSFAGQVCEVGFFTNALTAAQVQTLYNSLGVGPSIKTQPLSAAVGAGTVFTNVVIVSGNPPLFYQWYTNDVAYGGQTNASLVLNPVLASDASTNYYLVVTNIAGSVTSAVVSLTVYTTPVIGAELPITYSNVLGTNYLTLYAGANPTYSISAVGAPPVYYQWFTNGASVGGATNTALMLANVNIDTINSYCIATNSLGSATSTVWSASVIADPPDSGSGLAPYPQSVLALHPVGYWRLNEMDDGNFDGNPGAISLDYAGGNNGIYTNVYLANNGAHADPGYNPITDPTDTAALFGFYNPNNCDAGEIGTNIDFSVPAGNNAEFSVECWVNFAQTNVCGIVTKGYGNGGEEFSLDNDVPGLPKFFVRNAAGTGIGVNVSLVESNNVWYHMVAVCDEANSNMVLYVNGHPVGVSNSPALYRAGIFNDVSANMLIGARSPSLGAGNNNQTIGSINDVAVFNYALSPSQVADQYDSGGGVIAPYLMPTPPANVTNVANATLTIPVTAFGTPPIGYQWTNLNTGATVAASVTNATSLNATLIYSNVPASWDGNQLELIVTNNYGSTNVFLTLSITNQVTINPNPTNLAFSVAGSQLTLSWPSDHTGWTLQAQTNGPSAGISSTNWFAVGGSAATDQVSMPINLTNGSVFYRLVYP